MSLVSLYDEASLWMTPSGAKDGRLFSELPVPEFGNEILTQPVDIDADFITNAGGVIVDANTFTTAGGSLDGIIKNGLIQASKQYRLEIQGTTTSSGFTIGNGQASGNEYGTGFGVHYFTSASTNLWIRQNTAGTTDITTFSIKEVSNIGDFTFSRGSNLAATRVGPTGLIEKGRENLLPYSNAFTSGDWQDTGASYFTSGQSGYDGTNDAWRFTTVNQGERFQIVSSVVTGKTGVHTLSAYFKKGTADGVRMRVDMSGTDANIYVNLLDGNIFNSVGDIAAKLTDIGGGWYRAELTANWVNVLNIRIYPTNTTGNDAVGTIYIQSAQLEIGLAATDYIESGATTGKAGLLENEPRLDYSGGATCPSLLLEPQRTNGLFDSEYFGGSNWAKGAVSVTDNNAISPEGVQNASLITADGTTTQHYILATSSQSAKTLSIFAKMGTQRYVQILTSGSAQAVANYDLQDGLYGNEGSATTADMEDYGNGWYRLILSSSDSLTGNFYLNFVDSLLQGRFAATSSSGTIYVYGAQGEASASYPTSYIPTYGSSVTRSADTSSLTGFDFFPNGEGTAMIEFEIDEITISGFPELFRINNPSAATNFLFCYIYELSGDVRVGYRLDVDNVKKIEAAASIALGTNKMVVRIQRGACTAFLNGTEIPPSQTYNGVADVNMTSLRINAQSFIANERIKQFATFPTGLTDSECIKLTTL